MTITQRLKKIEKEFIKIKETDHEFCLDELNIFLSAYILLTTLQLALLRRNFETSKDFGEKADL